MTIEDLLDGEEVLPGEGRLTFRAQWFGYDRDQVHEELARREAQVALIRADRDSALATAEDLARHLQGARLQLGEPRIRHTGHDKGDAVSGCIRYILHTRSRVAEEAADRRVQLLDEAAQESQRRLAETGERACDIVGRALRESRATLDDLFERQRALEDWYSSTAQALNLPSQRQGEPQSIQAIASSAAMPYLSSVAAGPWSGAGSPSASVRRATAATPSSQRAESTS